MALARLGRIPLRRDTPLGQHVPLGQHAPTGQDAPTEQRGRLELVTSDVSKVGKNIESAH